MHYKHKPVPITTHQELTEAATDQPVIYFLWFTLLRYLFPKWYRRNYEERLWYGEIYPGAEIPWGFVNWWYDNKLKCARGNGRLPEQEAKIHGATHWMGTQGQTCTSQAISLRTR